MWNRKYFLDIYSNYAGHSQGYLESYFHTIQKNILFDSLQNEECSANIIVFLAKFADEILTDYQKDNTITFEQVEERINQFLIYLSDKDINVSNSYKWAGRMHLKEEIFKGYSVYRSFKSSFAEHYYSRYADGSVFLTIKRVELRRIIYQFLLNEEIDFQGFCLYLNYDKSKPKLMYRANTYYKAYVKNLMDKDIPMKHVDSKDNIKFTVGLKRLELVTKELNAVLI